MRSSCLTIQFCMTNNTHKDFRIRGTSFPACHCRIARQAGWKACSTKTVCPAAIGNRCRRHGLLPVKSTLIWSEDGRRYKGKNRQDSGNLYFEGYPMKGRSICGGPLTKEWPETFHCSLRARLCPRTNSASDETTDNRGCADGAGKSRGIEAPHLRGLERGLQSSRTSRKSFFNANLRWYAVVNQALKILREVLQEKGSWPLEAQEE